MSEELYSRLDSLYEKRKILLAERIPLQSDYKEKLRILKKSHRMLEQKNAEIKDNGQQIFNIKNGGLTPHVSDHAIVRYLERVEGVDIWELRDKVASCDAAVIVDNTIVTVNEDLSSE